MPFGWQIFRIICLLQMLATTYYSFISLISLFNGNGIYYLFETIAFAIIAIFAIFALNLLNNNYPDKPVAGKQKAAFNWLFLLNFLLLIFLFAHFFAAFRSLREITDQLRLPSLVDAPTSAWMPPIMFSAILFLHLVLIYGLYILRRLLFINFFSRQQFEFEEKSE